MDWSFFKLEIFIPETHFAALQEALRTVDAGHIGRYDSCLNYSEVRGTWRALEGAHPFSGEPGVVSDEPEYKVEVTICADKLEETLECIHAVHPYEEPVVNVIPLYATGLTAQS